MGRKQNKQSKGPDAAAPKTGDIVLKEDPKFSGTFPWRVPTLRDEIEIGAQRSTLAKGYGVEVDDLPSDTAALIRVIAYMRVLSKPIGEKTYDPRPAWWHASGGGERLLDSSPMLEYWMEGAEREKTFRGPDEDARAASDDAEGRDGPGSSDEEGVGGEVQPPAKRREVVVSHDT